MNQPEFYFRVWSLRAQWFVRQGMVGAVAFTMLLLPFEAAAADDEEDDDEEVDTLTPVQRELARKFAGVEAWDGIWEATVAGQESRRNEVGYVNSQWEASGRGRFRLERSRELDWQPKQGNFTWLGTGE